MAAADAKTKVKGKAQPRQRSKTSYPKLYDLYTDLEPLAEAQDDKVAWDGTSYSKSTRNCRPDPFSLMDHSAILEVLAKHSPTGYPSYAILKSCFVQLSKLHDIFAPNKKAMGDLFDEGEVAGDAADQWRLMMRHLLEIKLGPTKVPSKLEHASNYLVDFGQNESVGDDDGAEICGFMCFCKECIQLRSEVIDLDADHSEPETIPGEIPIEEKFQTEAKIGTKVNDTLAAKIGKPSKFSLAVDEDDEFVKDLSIPSAKIGGQREETRPAETEEGKGKRKGKGKGKGRGKGSGNQDKPNKGKPKLILDSQERRRVSKKRPAPDTPNQSALPVAASASDQMVFPITPNYRRNVEMYLMQPTGCPPPRYCGTVTVKECPNYIDVANKLADELNGGLIVNSRRALKLRKTELIAEWS